LLHHRQELPRVGRQRLDVAPLPFGVEGVEGQAGLARAGQAGDDDQLVARQVQRDVFEVVRARTADMDGIHGSKKVLATRGPRGGGKGDRLLYAVSCCGAPGFQVRRECRTTAVRPPARLSAGCPASISHAVFAAMNSKELKATFGLGAVYALRMLGVFMILPIFELYAKGLPAHPAQSWITAAMIASAVAQALFQILLGRLSDRIGRKPVIAMGMLVFALGSYVAGSTDRIEWIAFGRFLQGAGAISSAVTALLADVTREEVRTIAIAIMGAGMGLAFVLAIILGSAAEDLLGGVRGIFKLTAVLSLLAIPVVWLAVPAAEQRTTASSGSIGQVFADAELLRLSGGILLLHAAVLCLFTG